MEIMFQNSSQRELFVLEKSDELYFKRMTNSIQFLTEQVELLDDQFSKNLITEDQFIAEATDVNGKKTSVLSSILEKMRNILNNIIEKITDALDGKGKDGKSHLTVEEYLKSDTAAKRFNCDIRRYTDECDKGLTEGQKLLREIGRNGGVSEDKIDAFETLVTRIIKKGTPVILGVGTAVAGLKYAKKKVNGWNSIIKNAEVNLVKENIKRNSMGISALENRKISKREVGSAIYKTDEAKEYRKGSSNTIFNAKASPDEQNARVLSLMGRLFSSEQTQTMGYLQKLYTKEVVKNKMQYK